MRVSSSSNFSSVIETVNSFKTSLDQLEGRYVHALSDIESYMSGVNFSSWSDLIEIKLEDFYRDRIVVAVDTIRNDISSGSFKALIDTLDDLSSALDVAKGIKSSISGKESDRDSARSRGEDITSYTNDISTLNNRLGSEVDYCNQLLIKIENIIFNSTIPTVTRPSTPPTTTTTTKPEEEPFFSSSGGRDGHHYTSRAAAVAYYMTYAYGGNTVDARTAGRIVDEYIADGTIVIDSGYTYSADGGSDGHHYTSRAAAVAAYMNATGCSASDAGKVVDGEIQKGKVVIGTPGKDYPSEFHDYRGNYL